MTKSSLLRVLLLAFALFVGSVAYAQPFAKALGVRLGYPLSVSYKQFVSPKNAFEVYAGGRGYRDYRGFSLSGAYQVHHDISGIRGLQFYYGGGVGVHLWEYDNRNFRSNTIGSLSGYLGLQYVFPDIPISLTADWVPTFFLGGRRDGYTYRRFGGDYGALGIRYNFR